MAQRIRIQSVSKDFRKPQVARLLAQLPELTVSASMRQLGRLPWTLPHLPPGWKAEELVRTLQKLDCQVELLGTPDKAEPRGLLRPVPEAAAEMPGRPKFMPPTQPRKPVPARPPPASSQPAEAAAEGPPAGSPRAAGDSTPIRPTLHGQPESVLAVKSPAVEALRPSAEDAVPGASGEAHDSRTLVPSPASAEAGTSAPKPGPRLTLPLDAEISLKGGGGTERKTRTWLSLALLFQAVLLFLFLCWKFVDWDKEGARLQAGVARTVQAPGSAASPVSAGASAEEYQKAQALNDAGEASPPDIYNPDLEHSSRRSRPGVASGDRKATSEQPDRAHADPQSLRIQQQLSETMEKFGEMLEPPRVTPDYARIKMAIAEKKPEHIYEKGYFIYRAAEAIYSEKEIQAEMHSGDGVYEMGVPAGPNPMTFDQFSEHIWKQ